MALEVRGKAFLVAGAGKGLGFAVARCLAGEGAGVVIANRGGANMRAL